MSSKNKTEIWYQPGDRETGFQGRRYRLFYKNKNGFWVASFNFYRYSGHFTKGFVEPRSWDEGCFSSEFKFETKEALLKAMREYDRNQGFPKAIKLGDFL